MPSHYDDIRSKVVAELRRVATHNRAQEIIREVSVDNFKQFAPSDSDKVELFGIFHDLVKEGILVPGMTSSLIAHATIPAYDARLFTMTPFGRRALTEESEVDPHEGDYVESVLSRLRDPSDVVKQYLSESVASYKNQHFLAAAVLLGVASEDLLERVYRVFEQHLSVSRRTNFRETLDQKRRSAEGRFEYFRKSFEPHRAELEEEFRRRVDTHLGLLVNVLKLSRDDVGHARPARITREVAHMNLVAFPVLVGIVAELETALKANCNLT